MSRRPRVDREPDVEIAASVRARELRFECKPETRVVLRSNAPAEGDLESDRAGLPDEVEPDVTYHDVAVRWRAGVRLKDEVGDPGLEPRPGHVLRSSAACDGP
jgi:hypothetical protein